MQHRPHRRIRLQRRIQHDHDILSRARGDGGLAQDGAGLAVDVGVNHHPTGLRRLDARHRHARAVALLVIHRHRRGSRGDDLFCRRDRARKLDHRARPRRTRAVDRHVGVARLVEVKRRRERKAANQRHRPVTRQHTHDRAALGRRTLVGEYGKLHRVDIAVRADAQVGEHGQVGGIVGARAGRRHDDNLGRAGHKRRAAQQRHIGVAVGGHIHTGRHRVRQHLTAAIRVGEDTRNGREGRHQFHGPCRRVNPQQGIGPGIGHQQLAFCRPDNAVRMRLLDGIVRVHPAFHAPRRHDLLQATVRAHLEHRRSVGQHVRRAGAVVDPDAAGHIQYVIDQRQPRAADRLFARKDRGQHRHVGLRPVGVDLDDTRGVAIGHGDLLARGSDGFNLVIAAQTGIHNPNAAVRRNQHALRRVEALGHHVADKLLGHDRRGRSGQHHRQCQQERGEPT